MFYEHTYLNIEVYLIIVAGDEVSISIFGGLQISNSVIFIQYLVMFISFVKLIAFC